MYYLFSKRTSLAIFIATCLMALVIPVLAQSGDLSWTTFEQLSSPAPYVSEPKITTDLAGNLHVFWTQKDESGYGVIYYSRYTDGVWSTPVDVLFSPEGEVAWIMDVEVDQAGYLHALFVSNNNILYHSSAHITQASIVHAWAEPSPLAFGVASSGWGADMVVDAQGWLHLVYCDGFTPRLFYMRSETDGATWTIPQAVDEPELLPGYNEGADSTMLALDNTGQLHVVWTTRVLPGGWPGVRAFYARSLDSGNNWQDTVLVDTIENSLYAENRGPFFLSLGLRTNGEVHLAWAGAPNGDRWHQWSRDGGQTWTDSQMILGRRGERYGTTGFLAMVEASDGILRLFTTFQARDGGLIEATWNGTQWSDPESLPFGDLNCEDPRVSIASGNELHLVCVNSRGGDYTDSVNHTWKVLSTLRTMPIPLPTVELLPQVTPTLTPTVSSDSQYSSLNINTASPSVSNANVLPIAISSLVALLLVSVVVVLQGASRR